MPRRGVVAAVIAAALVVAPVFRQPPRDSFPLSTYPMFATDRGPVAAVNTVLGVDAEGATHTLSPEIIGGSDEVILAAATVTRAIRDRAADGLCETAAERVDGDDLLLLRVVTHRYDTVAYLAGEREPIDEVVHAECPA
ncbi:MAG: hypothetical protein ACRDJP_16785 [Actinomycetota bacterium]